MNLLTTQEAADRLGVTRRRIQELIQLDRLPARKIGRDYVIRESDLKLVEERKPGRPRREKTPVERPVTKRAGAKKGKVT
jgi:excisionase family DNA binding protein